VEDLLVVGHHQTLDLVVVVLVVHSLNLVVVEHPVKETLVVLVQTLVEILKIVTPVVVVVEPVEPAKAATHLVEYLVKVVQD
jgi:hypothetical protein